MTTYSTKRLTAFKALSPAKQFATFKKWVSEQPRDKSYDYQDNRGCAIVQFGKSLIRGSRHLFVSSGGAELNIRVKGEGLQERLSFAEAAHDALEKSGTFGELARRIKSLKYSSTIE